MTRFATETQIRTFSLEIGETARARVRATLKRYELIKAARRPLRDTNVAVMTILSCSMFRLRKTCHWRKLI